MSSLNVPTEEKRPPVVVVLGHVDHGKTSLLDAIRKTKVADKESGGITQHIGAYQATINGRLITFLDTPGHEAFASIRSRGAKVADVAILVVAADDNIKPQAKEAIKIINDEKIPFVVAINKIDRESANPQRIRQELAAENVFVEGWGGTVPVVEISARQNRGIDDLLEMVLLVADLEDLADDRTLPAEGVIIESNLDKQRGYVATALVKKGILEVGDFIVVGSAIGKIKSMEDFIGKALMDAVPSQPVLITGWPSAPFVGKQFKSAYSKDEALHIVESNVDFGPVFKFLKSFSVPHDPSKKVLNVIFKSDVSSSLEAIESVLAAIKSEEVICRVMGYDVGNIQESDIKLAISSRAKVYGFRVDIESSARKLAEKNAVSVATFDIIYELIEAVRKDMSGLLEPEIKVNILGKIRILASFKLEIKSQIIGGKITSGKAIKGGMVNVMRGGSILTTGKITQLQQNKEDASEVREGVEAGMKFEPLAGKDNAPIKEGDILEVFEEEKIQRTI